MPCSAWSQEADRKSLCLLFTILSFPGSQVGSCGSGCRNSTPHLLYRNHLLICFLPIWAVKYAAGACKPSLVLGEGTMMASVHSAPQLGLEKWWPGRLQAFGDCEAWPRPGLRWVLSALLTWLLQGCPLHISVLHHPRCYTSAPPPVSSCTAQNSPHLGEQAGWQSSTSYLRT